MYLMASTLYFMGKPAANHIHGKHKQTHLHNHDLCHNVNSSTPN